MNDWVYRGAKLGIFTAFLSVIIALWSYSNAKGIDVFSTPLEERESETAPEHSLWKKPTGNNYFGTAGLSLLNKMDPKNIEDYLRYLTSTGHMAGTKQDLEQAEFMKEFFLEHGIDSAHLQPYNVQLSYPDISNPNKVYLIDGNGSVKFTSRILEENQNGVPYDESIPPAFMAFSPAGSITTKELVFVNYGRYEDFQQVKAMGINITGKIVIAKFGRIFRGDKVLNAQRFNATGVILYTDPSDYHPDSDSGGPSYPNSYWLPGSGIQRGSIMWRDGDPTTPFYPSIDGVNRVQEELQHDVPKIITHTLSYNDARKILINMAGPEVPEDWKGRLNITYRMGPQLQKEGWSLKMEVNNQKRTVSTYNVVGMIRGLEEPDRYVILGNHRDSWTFGSFDPSSGTAVQLELTRAFGHMLKQGWRPRRSILLLSWGAGEYGFFGATEWVEEYLKIFESRVVAYLNVDLALTFNYNLRISATPLLHKIITEALKATPAPDPSLDYKTLWDHWIDRNRAASPKLLDWEMASSSEHAPFYQRIGIPVLNMLWSHDNGLYNWTDYPLYHTAFEDFEAIKNILDPTFAYHLSLGHLWGLMTIGLADAKILPMNPEDETSMLEGMIEKLQEDFEDFFYAYDISIDPLKATIQKFSQVAKDFNTKLRNLSTISPLQGRQFNDQLMLLERCFADDQGSPYRTHMKNIVFGTSIFNQYAAWEAPSVRETVWEAVHCTTECSIKIHLVKQQLSALQHAINSAVLALEDVRTL